MKRRVKMFDVIFNAKIVIETVTETVKQRIKIDEVERKVDVSVSKN